MTTSPVWAIIWITIALSGLAAAAPVGWSIPSLIAPKGGTGTIGGVMNFANNLMGAIAPVVTGFMVGATHSFSLAFLVAGIVLLIGIFSFVVVLGRIEPIRSRTRCATAGRRERPMNDTKTQPPWSSWASRAAARRPSRSGSPSGSAGHSWRATGSTRRPMSRRCGRALRSLTPTAALGSIGSGRNSKLGRRWQVGIMTCSALKRAYRDRIRAARPDVRFVYLKGRRR